MLCGLKAAKIMKELVVGVVNGIIGVSVTENVYKVNRLRE